MIDLSTSLITGLKLNILLLVCIQVAKSKLHVFLEFVHMCITIDHRVETDLDLGRWGV